MKPPRSFQLARLTFITALTAGLAVAETPTPTPTPTGSPEAVGGASSPTKALSEELAAAWQEVETLKRQVSEAAAKISEREQAFEKAKVVQEERIQSLLRREEEAVTQLRLARDRLTDLRETNQRLAASVAEIRGELAVAQSQLRSRSVLNPAITADQKAVDELKAELARRDDRLQELQAKVRSLSYEQSELDQARAQRAAMETELSLAKTKITTLALEAKTERDALALNAKRFAELRAEMEKMRMEVAGQLDRAKAEGRSQAETAQKAAMEAWVQERQALQEKFAEADLKRQQAEAALAQSGALLGVSEELRVARARLAELENERQILVQARLDAEKQAGEALSRIQQLASELEGRTAELVAAKGAATSATESAGGQLAEAQRRIQELETQLTAQTTAQRGDLEAKLAEAGKDAAQAREALAVAQQEKATLTAQLEEQRQNAALEIKQVLAQAQSEQRKLAESLAQQESQARLHANKELGLAQTKIQELEARLAQPRGEQDASANERVSALEANLRTVTTQWEEAKQRLALAEAEAAKVPEIEGQLAAVTRDFQKLKGDEEGWRRVVQQREEKLSAEQEQARQTWAAQLSAALAEREELRTQLAALAAAPKEATEDAKARVELTARIQELETKLAEVSRSESAEVEARLQQVQNQNIALARQVEELSARNDRLQLNLMANEAQLKLGKAAETERNELKEKLNTLLLEHLKAAAEFDQALFRERQKTTGEVRRLQQELRLESFATLLHRAAIRDQQAWAAAKGSVPPPAMPTPVETAVAQPR